MSNTIFELFQNIENDDSCLVYMGQFDDHFTEMLIDINEAAAESDKKSTRKKVSFLIAECFQNIIRHGDDDFHTHIHADNPKMFSIRNLDGVYYMCTSNIVNNDKVPQLEKSLKSLLNVSKEKLKEIYLNSLENNEHNEAGGAGLGLIEMARRSKKAPDFYFEQMNADWSNFFMQIEIIPKRLTESRTGGNIPIELSRKLYKLLVDNNILLLRKGNLSQKNVLPLFRLIEGNVKNTNAGPTIDKKGIYVLIEMLQNVSKHGFSEYNRTEGIITIAQREEHFEISTGNFIHKDEVEDMRKKLQELSNMNLATLKRHYKKTLFNFEEESTKGGAGIGLIEMHKIGKKPLTFEFIPVNNKLHFFSITITI